MSKLLAKILLAMIMFPAAFLIFIVTFAITEPNIRDEYAFFWSFSFTALFVAGYWLSLWRQSVCWTKGRIAGTWISVIGSLLGGAFLGAIVSALTGGPDEEVILGFGSIFSILIWLVVTILIWRETPAERAERVKQSAGDVLFCLKCSYNMTGLYESRCPECGTKYTLDQLLAGQKREVIEESTTKSQESST
ncbi:MAG: hypothetical protein ACYTF1_02775 [Planctomycetota bacterium]|jgi:peptidoglycan/LPS O-acetylase OafA/YrhL